MVRQLIIIIFCIFSFGVSYGQISSTTKLHAHNDYEHAVPFWEAFSHGFSSIEADVLLIDDKLFVAHEKETIKQERTLETLYFQPIEQAFELNLWNDRHVQLLIDVKTEAYATLDKIVATVTRHPAIIKAVGDGQLSLVISGNRPKASEYHQYPSYIQFDYQQLENPGPAALEKIDMVSLSFRYCSGWNGKGRLVDEDLERVKAVVDQAHALNKPFRFWATPDSKTSWKAFSDLGVDYINTDLLAKAAAYVGSLEQQVYSTDTKHDVYVPNFKVDGKSKKVKNIILLIGDGMGLGQVSAGMFANQNDLTLTQLKHIGLSKTQAADDFTTDSAAGGTAMATGTKTKNRYIGLDPSGNKLTNLPEHIAPLGFVSGIVTTDQLTGATPSSFYAHQPDRGMTEAIANDLKNSPLSLVIGAGGSDFDGTDILDVAGFSRVGELNSIAGSNKEKVAHFASPGGLKSKPEGRGNYLPEAIKAATTFLSSKKAPFFLMVEGAFIDSGGHANRTDMVVEEMLDFDLTIEQALRFADANGETLVIVTADHETGGLSLPQGNLNNREVEGQFHTHDHTGIMVPVFAYGPHAQDFSGVYENTEINTKIKTIIGKYYK